MNELLLHRRNKINKRASIETQGDLNGKESVIGTII